MFICNVYKLCLHCKFYKKSNFIEAMKCISLLLSCIFSPSGKCVFVYICQELLWGEGGLVLPVAGLVHVSAHPACSHWGHCLPLWPCLLQQLTPHVSFFTTLQWLCHNIYYYRVIIEVLVVL